jgi:lysophospholipase L1-like esterase
MQAQVDFVMIRLLLAGMLVSGVAWGQLADEFRPPKTNCCLPAAAQTLADQLQDWNALGRFHDANAALKKQTLDPARVIFFGDSITEGWKLVESFPGKPYVNRGISGQTTPQLLVRMFPDVIDLEPAAFVMLAGTNDIARNTGPETLEMIEENVQAMVELAQLHKIRVILCSVLPVSDYTHRKQTPQRPPADILKVNAWLRDYAARSRAAFVDYYSALVDENGMLKEGYSEDGLHPNGRGYEIMAPLAEAAISKALAETSLSK